MRNAVECQQPSRRIGARIQVLAPDPLADDREANVGTLVGAIERLPKDGMRAQHPKVVRADAHRPDPLGFAVPPEAGCVHPTSGADTMLRWCCTTALCSHFPSRDARCDCQSANRYDYNCAPGATAAAACAANGSGDFCCPFN